MASLIDELRAFIFGKPAPRRRPSTVRTPPPAAAPAPMRPPSSIQEAQSYVERVTGKINRLAEEFARGAINRTQFQELFDHYQRERQTIVGWIEARADGDWRQAASEGQSVVIRARHSAKVLGYAVYENDSGMPLSTIGQFDIDPALAVPMLSAYRSATKEIFGGELRSTAIEGGKWLSFIPGEHTTLLAIFSTEPARQQLQRLEELHLLFERANRHLLARQPINPNQLALPHASFLGRIS